MDYYTINVEFFMHERSKSVNNSVLKTVKFGGSSLASAEQFRKVKEIITAEESRRYVIPSAPGKRFSSDTKVTDMLYKCYEMASKGEDITEIFSQIRERYNSIIEGLGLDMSLEKDFSVIESALIHRIGKQRRVSQRKDSCKLLGI